MIEFDLLFTDEDHKRVSASIFGDFSFENIETAVFEDEPILFRSFKEVLKYPLVDADKIKERGAIIKDFLIYNNFLNDLYDICANAKNYKPKHLGNAAEDKLGNSLDRVEHLVNVAENINRIFQGRTFISETLRKIQKYFSRTDEFDRLLIMLKELLTFTNTHYVSVNLTYNNKMNLLAASPVSVTPPQNDASPDKFRLFGKKQPPAQNFVRHNNYMISMLTDELNGKLAAFINKTFTSVSYAIQRMLESISKQLLFYKAALKIIKFYNRHGIINCFPEFTNTPEINAKHLIDFSFFSYLAIHSEDQTITDNDFSSENAGILFITGPNQGGKTTFVRSLGIAQLFAQSGLPVAAEKYGCGIFNALMTHFPKPEDDDLNYGKLAEELMRIKEDFPMTKEGALILMNESFATTTVNEGMELARDFLKAASKPVNSTSLIIFVTHFYELAVTADKLAEEIGNDFKIINCVAGYIPTDGAGENTKRTYKIMRGVPQKQVFASDLLHSHR